MDYIFRQFELKEKFVDPRYTNWGTSKLGWMIIGAQIIQIATAFSLIK